MTASSRRAAAAGSVVVVLALVTGVILLAYAMRLYPGGTAIDPRQPGHSFWTNFLCDLTGEVAFNGGANHRGAMVARAGMGALTLGMLSFWLILPFVFPGHRVLAGAIRICGATGSAALAVVPFAPGLWHVVVVFAAVIPALAAAALGVWGSVGYSRRRGLAALAVGTVLVTLVDAVLYAQSYLVTPRVVTPALPLLQRVAVMILLAWMAATAAIVWRARRSQPG